MLTFQRKANKTMMSIAVNPETPPELLHELSFQLDPDLLERVSENQSAMPETLARLAKHDCTQVRIAVGRNRQTPLSILWILVDDPCCDIRYSLAENPMVPVAVLEALLADDNPYVGARAKQTLGRILPPIVCAEFAADNKKDSDSVAC